MMIPFPSRPRRVALAAACATGLSLGAVLPAHATTEDDVRALQKQMAEMKADYDRRLAALEAQLQAARAAQAAAPATPPVAAPAVPEASPPPPPSPAPTADAGGVGGAANGATAFNPSVSLILSGLYTHSTRDPKAWRLTGVALPPDAEVGPGTRGFSLSESELAMSASIDPWLRGSINLSITPDDTISAEEAWIQTSSLPAGLGLKAGRFYSGIGYLNSQHSHTWDFVDAPLAYQAFLGTQLADDGLQLHWLAPIDQYVELGAEVGRGRAFPGGFANAGGGSNSPGQFALTAHAGGDIGDSSSWRAGLSFLRARAEDQGLTYDAPVGQDPDLSFTGSTRVWVLDGVWKWAPEGNATRTNFKLQGEWLHSVRDGALAAGTGPAGPWRASQSGGYLQAVWQFMPMWRVGLRTDRLDLGSDLALPAGDHFVPRRQSLMVDFNPSEFSRIRLQFSRDEARQGAPDNQVMLQFQTSLGAHGAHSY